MTDVISERLAVLEAHVAAKPTFTDIKSAVDATKLGHLKELRAVREAIANGGGGSSKENDDLRKENEALKKLLAKRDYRIKILLNSLSEEEAKNKER